MGKTFIIFKVNPKDMEHLEVCEKELRACAHGHCKDVQRAPIGFGVVVLKAGYLIEEKKDDAIELLTNEIKHLPSVDDVEVEGMTLV